MNTNVFIGFDFSINKPACTIVINRKIHFFIWPIHLSKNEISLYEKTDITFKNRNLEAVSKKHQKSTSEMVKEHTKRSVELANMIVNDIKEYINQNYDERFGIDIYVSSEGLSFASKGNSTLDLATYKGVLLAEIYKILRPANIFTYAPITIKKVAGIDKSVDFTDKTPMISAFKKEPIECKFKDMILDGELIASKNYIHCVDDIVDSYFCCKTMYKKEKMRGVDIWNE